ncbi:hypothetical protein XENTR_v10011053 [Xenopus tropicalis]|nr:hypothetical protein XENTR_v10011053 [Xenopus tropicalis]
MPTVKEYHEEMLKVPSVAPTGIKNRQEIHRHWQGFPALPQVNENPVLFQNPAGHMYRTQLQAEERSLGTQSKFIEGKENAGSRCVFLDGSRSVTQIMGFNNGLISISILMHYGRIKY